MENITIVGKRVNLDVKNIKRIKIMSTLLENEVKKLNERKNLIILLIKPLSHIATQMR